VPELAQIEKVVFLQSADLFAYCKAEQILHLASIARERIYSEGETIFVPNQPAGELHCVVRGQVRLNDARGETSAGPLQAFGVRDVLTGRLRTGTAVAGAGTLLLSIDTDDFFDLLAHDVEIVKAIFRQCLGDGVTG
jgi:CRP-like cAMP-binding protein